ncbi:PepSY domain-containing protein [Methylophilus rhizosphaerae]|uniref:PepSY-associated TM helix domain-containing protein n=1 Tax=Methylophilus rhizosphaerae TaxID=492660 RepID=UPI000B32420E
MNIQFWSFTHKWSSLICTLFLLMLCITGLPLVFHDEIDAWRGEVEAPYMPPGTPKANLDNVAEAARKQRPNDVIRFMSWNEAESPNQIFVTMAPNMDAPPQASKSVVIDSRTAKVLDAPEPTKGLIYFLFFMHSEMFAGLPGMLFLGLMGLVFVISVVSGVVLYRPFMRRIDFGTIRRNKGLRTTWLDLHNLLGATTISWVLVVGFTGTINTLNKVIINIWQKDQMAQMIAPYQNAPPLQHLGSIQVAVDAAVKAIPNMTLGFVATQAAGYQALIITQSSCGATRQ